MTKNRIDFLIAGNQKCGTTRIFKELRKHPKVRLSLIKELHFFTEGPWYKEELSNNFLGYHSFGWGVEDNQFSSAFFYGEGTPKYALWALLEKQQFTSKLNQYNPSLKYILIFRNPVKRAYSQWNMLRNKNKTNKSFKESIYQSPNDNGFCLPRGHYGSIVQTFLEAFPKNQLLFLKLGDLKNLLYQIEDFLEIDHHDYGEIPFKGDPYLEPMEEEIEKQLKAYYREENLLFEKLTGIPIDDWL